MSRSAWRGDAACKRAAIERLRGLEAAGTWVVRPIHWNGTAGSLVGSLLQGEDLEQWERRLGLPKWLALALDGLLALAPRTDQGIAFGIGLLAAIAPGADLRTAGSRCMLELLAGDAHGLAGLPQAAAWSEVLPEVIALHRAVLAGSAIAPAQWRNTRCAAVALTDTLAKDSLEAQIGACIEAAVWDPASSRTVVCDTLRTWIWAMDALAEQRSPVHWTPADDARIQILLGRLHAQAQAAASDPDAFIDVFELLEQSYPQDAARLRAHLADQRRRAATQWLRAAATLQRALAAVPGRPGVTSLASAAAWSSGSVPT